MSKIDFYEETAVVTQDRGRLVVMLYDGAIKYLGQAIREIEANNSEEKGRLICKAQDIIFELNTVLDMETGGEIALNLRKLYNFMWKHLGQANIKNDPRMLGEVIDLLVELNEGWKAVAS
jgi:flagellar protein FliS